jgi:glycine/D-amino acid oxidase-like deaminating enzyme
VSAPPSLWWSTLDQPVVARPTHDRHLDVDVAIVGGGFTGLWTARELKRRDPSLRICVLEKSVCGSGASRRNGGWASALFPVSDDALVARYGLESFTHQRQVLEEAVVELGRSATSDGIDAQFIQGGTLIFARSEVQAHRLRTSVEASRHTGSAKVTSSGSIRAKRAITLRPPIALARPTRHTVPASIPPVWCAD